MDKTRTTATAQSQSEPWSNDTLRVPELELQPHLEV